MVCIVLIINRRFNDDELMPVLLLENSATIDGIDFINNDIRGDYVIQ